MPGARLRSAQPSAKTWGGSTARSEVVRKREIIDCLFNERHEDGSGIEECRIDDAEMMTGMKRSAFASLELRGCR